MWEQTVNKLTNNQHSVEESKQELPSTWLKREKQKINPIKNFLTPKGHIHHVTGRDVPYRSSDELNSKPYLALLTKNYSKNFIPMYVCKGVILKWMMSLEVLVLKNK